MRQSLMEVIPMREAQFGLLLSVFLWTYALISPFAGFLTDRVGRTRVIISSLFVWSLTTLLTAHARTYNELLATRVLMGVSEACYIPAALALIADYHGSRTRSLATGVHMAGIMVGAGLGGIGGWLAERHTWNFPFSVFGTVGMVYALFLVVVLRDPAVAATDPGEPVAAPDEPPPEFLLALRSLLRVPSFLLCVGFFGVLGVLGWGLIGWLPTYFGERFHLSQGAAGFTATGYLSAASFVGVLLGGWLADLASRRNPRGRILVPMTGLLIAASGVLVLSLANVIWVAIAGLLIYGVTRTFSDSNMMPILCLVADRRYRGTGYGLINLVSCTIGGFGNYAAGALRDAHIDLSRMFLAMVGVLVVSAFLLSRIKPQSAVSLP